MSKSVNNTPMKGVISTPNSLPRPSKRPRSSLNMAQNGMCLAEGDIDSAPYQNCSLGNEDRETDREMEGQGGKAPELPDPGRYSN